MSAIRPLLRELSLRYYEWALREICPLHEDVPYLVTRINDLKQEKTK